MNLFLRPLEDVNDVTWGIIQFIILLAIIYTIIALAYEELKESDEGSSYLIAQTVMLFTITIATIRSVTTENSFDCRMVSERSVICVLS